VRSYALDRLSGVFERIGYSASLNPTEKAGHSSGSEGAPPEANKKAEGTTPANVPVALLRKYLSPVLSPFATVGIILVVAIFVLLQKEDLRDRMIRLFGSNDLHRTTVAMDDAAHRLSRYFLAQLGLNAAFGLIIGIGLYLIGVPNPVLWGILSGLLRFVPYIGSFISAGLPIAVAIAVDPGWSMVIWTIALYVVVELSVSQGIDGHSTGLSPFAVVVSAIFWSWLWGSVGLVLSMPLTLCLVVLGRHVDRLEFLDVLLGDRPPLTPVESFYQRMLAGDADETQDHAELLLKERSLSSYYDEVALKGLQLEPTTASAAPSASASWLRSGIQSKALFASSTTMRIAIQLLRTSSPRARRRTRESSPKPLRLVLSLRPALGLRNGKERRPFSAWPAKVPSTNQPQRCWHSFSKNMGLGARRPAPKQRREMPSAL
jgi:AI-2E family transporter